MFCVPEVCLSALKKSKPAGMPATGTGRGGDVLQNAAQNAVARLFRFRPPYPAALYM
jgi:hypothetical protein